MRHSLYVNNSKVIPKHKRIKKTELFKLKMPKQKNATEKDILDLRLSTIMRFYEKDLNKKQEIKNDIELFLINIAIAHDLKSKKLEKERKKELLNYLSKLAKEINKK